MIESNKVLPARPPQHDGAGNSLQDGVAAAIRRLADEPTRGLFLYSAFDKAPAFYAYRQLYERIAGCMEQFRAHGVGPGTRVLLPFDTSIDVITSFLALIAMGALTFSVRPLNARGGDAARTYLETVCRRYGVGYVVRPAGSAVAGLPGQELVPAGTTAAEANFAPATASDLAFVQFSSGSASTPKGIPVARAMLDRHLRSLIAFDGRTRDDVYVSWLPLYHDLGLILGMLTSIYARNALHLIPSLEFIRDPLGWLRIMSQHRATHTATAYFAIDYCLNHLERADDDDTRDWDFDALRVCLIGSDPTDYDRTLEFQKRLASRGFRRRALLPAYGMAEAVLVISATEVTGEPWAHTLADGRKLTANGRLLAGFEARITREDGSLCAEGELGQVEVRGGTMAAGYFEEPSIPFYNADGYFETGDLAYGVRGELVIAGRAGDRIKVNGQTLFSSDFEFAVQSLPFVKTGRAVVFQIGSRIVVLAQATKAGADVVDEYRRAVSAAIAKRLGVKLPPEDIFFVAAGTIQKTSSGKLKRRAMAQAFIDGAIRFAPGTVAPSDQPDSRSRSAPARVDTQPNVEISHAR